MSLRGPRSCQSCSITKPSWGAAERRYFLECAESDSVRRWFLWGKRVLSSEVRTGQSEAARKRFLLSVLVRKIVLCLEDKPSPEEKELIQAPWVVSALPRLQRWANAVQWSTFLCVFGLLQNAFSFKPWCMLCPEGLMLFQLFWSAQNRKLTTSELVCKIHQHMWAVWRWPCHAQRVEWGSDSGPVRCCNCRFGGRGTSGVICSRGCRAV